MLIDAEVTWLKANNITDINRVEQFKHALTNEVFLVTTRSAEQFIFKRLNRDARSDQDRQEEILVQQLTSEHGLTSIVLAHNEHYKLQQFIKGNLIAEDRADLNDLLATQFHRIHQLPAKYAPKQRLYLELQRLKKQLPVSIDELEFSTMCKLALQLDTNSACDTLCHGDLSLNNVLQGDDQKIYIIDWEYAVIACAAYDLAFCNCINQFSTSQARALITTYHQQFPNPCDASLHSLQKECDLYLEMFNYINELWALCFMDNA